MYVLEITAMAINKLRMANWFLPAWQPTLGPRAHVKLPKSHDFSFGSSPSAKV